MLISGGGSGFNFYDYVFNLMDEKNINVQTSFLTEVGLNKLNDMFVNGKLLGLNEGDPVIDASNNNYFDFIPFLVRDETYYMFSTTVFKDGNTHFIQINIIRQTGAVEIIEKILTTTNA